MRKIWLLIPLAILGLIYYGSAQTQPNAQKIEPATHVVPAKDEGPKPRDGRLPEAARPIEYSAQQATEWLKRTQMADGRFVYGFQPSLRVQLDGDNFASQAGAALALARASRYFRDASGAANARQALLTLLRLETMIDPEDATKSARCPAAPPFAVNRLSSNGLLISAIHELGPAKCPKDLCEYSDQLCQYIRQHQRPDGSLLVAAALEPAKGDAAQADAEHAGWALQGVIRSHKQQPADWKCDLLRKARAHYLPQWNANKSIAVVCSHTPAYAEAFVQTKDPAFKDAVFAMNDWLISLQYRDDFDAARAHWAGGFQRFRAGKAELAAPDITSAWPAESLADACRVAKFAGDLGRLKEYERALLLNIRFLTSLQYNAEKTKHFVDPFRPYIRGAFHASHQDGNLRIDYTQHALCAMVQYLDAVID
jgi:hypothetical protein